VGWKNPELLEMTDVSRYKSVKQRDTIVTSDYNYVFPADIAIGYVTKSWCKERYDFS
jgi:rod shape-determining protein MreC